MQAWTALSITLPLTADAIYTLIRRLIRRENIFKAHRSHLYQRLQQSGWTHAQVASTYIGVTLLIAGSVLIWGIVGAWMGLAGVIAGTIAAQVYLTQRQRVDVVPPEAGVRDGFPPARE